MRCASAPDRAENTNISTVAGQQRGAGAQRRPAARRPAARRRRGRTTRPSAPYSSTVARFVTVNSRLRNSAGGTSGSCVWRMRRTNATMPTTANDARAEHRRIGPAARPGLGERPRRRAEAHDRERGADEIETARRVRIARFRHRRARADDDERGDGHVDEERPPPARAVDEPPADERTDRAGDAAEARPRARPRRRDRSRRKLACRIARLPGVSSAAPTPCSTRARDEHFDVRRRAAQQRRAPRTRPCR